MKTRRICPVCTKSVEVALRPIDADCDKEAYELFGSDVYRAECVECGESCGLVEVSQLTLFQKKIKETQSQVSILETF